MNLEHLFFAQPAHHVIFDGFPLEMKEVSGVIPYVISRINRPAIAAYLIFFLDDEVIVLRGGGVTQAGNAGSNNQIHSCQLIMLFFLIYQRSARVAKDGQRCNSRSSARMALLFW